MSFRGPRFRPFMVDTGLLRKDEAKIVKERLEKHIPGMKLKARPHSPKERPNGIRYIIIYIYIMYTYYI